MDLKNLINELRRAEQCPNNYSSIAGSAAIVLATLDVENQELRNAVSELKQELKRVKFERDAYQVYFRDLTAKPDCNTCEKRSCEYRPRLGATVRANCPLYRGPKKGDHHDPR